MVVVCRFQLVSYNLRIVVEIAVKPAILHFCKLQGEESKMASTKGLSQIQIGISRCRIDGNAPFGNCA